MTCLSFLCIKHVWAQPTSILCSSHACHPDAMLALVRLIPTPPAWSGKTKAKEVSWFLWSCYCTVLIHACWFTRWWLSNLLKLPIVAFLTYLPFQKLLHIKKGGSLMSKHWECVSSRPQRADIRATPKSSNIHAKFPTSLRGKNCMVFPSENGGNPWRIPHLKSWNHDQFQVYIGWKHEMIRRKP